MSIARIQFANVNRKREQDALFSEEAEAEFTEKEEQRMKEEESPAG